MSRLTAARATWDATAAATKGALARTDPRVTLGFPARVDAQGLPTDVDAQGVSYVWDDPRLDATRYGGPLTDAGPAADTKAG